MSFGFKKIPSPKNNNNKSSSMSSVGSMFGFYKILLKGGIYVAIGIFIMCVVMTIVTMFTTITGTVVQISDGTIYDYGEVKEEDLSEEEQQGDVAYNGDVYYTKAKMIVQAVMADPSLKAKADNTKIPNGVPNALRKRMTGKRGGNYHIVEVAYIFRELCNNDFYSKFKINNDYEVALTDRFLWAEFLQEECCGSGYEAYWDELSTDSWLEAHTDALDNDLYEGPFQLQDGYFQGRAYITFIPSLEKDNGEEYGIVKHGSLPELKDKMKYNADIRTNISTASHDKASDFHFCDMAASTNNISFQRGMSSKYKAMKAVFKSEADYEASKDSMTVIMGDLCHRGPGFYDFTNSGDTIIAGNSSCSTHMVIMGQLLQEGLFSDANLQSLNLNCDFSNWKDWIPWIDKLVKQSSKDSIAGIPKNEIANYLASHGYTGNPDGGISPFYKALSGYQTYIEAEAIVNAVFDELGLVLPTNGQGVMELKETKGQFQGLWSDKDGNTLTSEEMLSYKSKGNKNGQQNSKYVGLAEESSFQTVYSFDSFKGKFGDNVGVIWYHQTGNNSWGSFKTHPGAGDTIPYNFCGGYSTSITLSTMLHRYINPPEIIYAAHSYDARHGTNNAMEFVQGKGKFGAKNQNLLINEQMFNGKQVLKATMTSTLEKSEVDATLDAGGMVIVCFNPPIASTNAGHYSVIRDKDGNDYYLSDPNHKTDKEFKKVNHKFTFTELKNLRGGSVNYVVPGPGYEDYINGNTVTSNSSGSGGNGLSNTHDGDYKYWVQCSSSAGKHGNINSVCPKHLKSGCYLYCLLKVGRALGANFEPTSMIDKLMNKGYVQSDAYVSDATQVLRELGVSGYSVSRVDLSAKIDFSTTAGKKKLAKKVKEYNDKGTYVIVQIGTRSGAKHFVNMFSVDGKNIEAWDSGSWTTQASWDKFESYYKNKGETLVYGYRLVEK